MEETQVQVNHKSLISLIGNLSFVSDAVIFDNTYSWTKQKTLYYIVELHTCGDFDHELDEVSTGGNWTRLARDMQMTHL